MKPRKKMSDEDFEQRYLAEKDCLLEYETARAYYDEHMRPHNPDESFDDYCNRQLLQPASRIKLVCKQCGKVCAEEDEGPRLPPQVHYFCSIKCIKTYNIAHDISNDGLEDRSC